MCHPQCRVGLHCRAIGHYQPNNGGCKEGQMQRLIFLISAQWTCVHSRCNQRRFSRVPNGGKGPCDSSPAVAWGLQKFAWLFTFTFLNHQMLTIVRFNLPSDKWTPKLWKQISHPSKCLGYAGGPSPLPAFTPFRCLVTLIEGLHNCGAGIHQKTVQCLRYMNGAAQRAVKFIH